MQSTDQTSLYRSLPRQVLSNALLATESATVLHRTRSQLQHTHDHIAVQTFHCLFIKASGSRAFPRCLHLRSPSTQALPPKMPPSTFHPTTCPVSTAQFNLFPLPIFRFGYPEWDGCLVPAHKRAWKAK